MRQHMEDFNTWNNVRENLRSTIGRLDKEEA